jgi:hypothetical protein
MRRRAGAAPERGYKAGMHVLLPFLALGALGAVGVASMIPALAPTLALLRRQPGLAERSDAALTLMVLAQPLVLTLVGAALGAALAHRVGLVSIVASLARGEALPPVSPRSVATALALGFVAGALIVAIDVAWKLATIPGFREAAAKAAGASSPVSQRAMALLYGGVAEEVMIRWGLMTLLVWVGAWLAGARFAESPGLVLWPAIVLSAVLFGAGHLPKAASVAPLDAAVVIRVIGLNAVAGIAYGWLYWRHGLEHAMLAHLATHVAFWTATPLAVRLIA